MSKKYKIKYDRPGCIGCGACVVIAPKFWEMKDDGKSSLIKGEKDKKGWEKKKITQKDFDINLEAAESCPVEVIHIVDEETKEEII